MNSTVLFSVISVLALHPDFSLTKYLFALLNQIWKVIKKGPSHLITTKESSAAIGVQVQISEGHCFKLLRAMRVVWDVREAICWGY